MPSTAECLVLAHELEDRAVADLLALVAIPSVGGSAAEQGIQRWVADRLARYGVDVATWQTQVTQLEALPGYPGAEVQRDVVIGVLGRLAGGSSEPTVLVGHTDVVPPAGWAEAFEPRVDAGTVIGRGAADMKGGVAALIHVARVLHVAGVVPPRTLWFAPVSGEEDGGAGAFDLIRRLDAPPAACLVAEPTAGEIVVANAGALGFRITIEGRSAHAAERWEGVDALAAATAVHAALGQLEARLAGQVDPLLARWPVPHPTVIGTIAGGDWASTVMSSVTMTGRYGIPLGADADTARRVFENIVHGAVRSAHPAATAAVTWEGGQFAPARQDPEHPVVRRLVASHALVTGHEPVVGGTTYGSDLRLFLAAGIPTVLYGPGDASRAHAAGERVAIADVVRVAQVVLAWVLG